MSRHTTPGRTPADVSPAWEAFDRDYELQRVLRATDSARESETPAGRRRGRSRSAPARPSGARLFTCDATTDLASVRQLRNQSAATYDSLQARVAAAAQSAVAMIDRAVRALNEKPRWQSVRRPFQAAFGSLPEVVPSWKTPTMRWGDLGDLVAIRLRSAAKIIGGGNIRYFCWGDAKYPECRECPWPARRFACSSYRGRYQTCFGPSFWTASPALAALVLIHEAHHIYFGRLIAHGRQGGRLGNAHCYTHFVQLVNGLNERAVQCR